MVREAIARWLHAPIVGELDELRRDVKHLNIRLAAAKERQSMMSGVDFMGGGEGGSFEYESNAKLKGAEKWKTLRSMESDAHVTGALRSIVLPLQSASWEFKPASDKARDVEIAEFVAANLLREPSDKFGREYWTATPWKGQRLPEILDFLVSGYAMFGKTWRAVEGTGGMRQIYDRLVWLEPSSVDPRGWVLDGDALVAVKRTFRRPDGGYELRESIPAEEIALYPWNLRGARLEGSPFVRSMYGAWFRKDWLLRYAMMWVQKVGAPAPYGVYPQGGWEEADVQRLALFLQQMRGTAPVEAYGVFPMGNDGSSPEIKFAEADAGDVDRLRGLINGENGEIAHAGGTKSQLLGETASGSRSTADSQQSFELLLIQAVAEIICEFENFGASTLTGVVEDLVNRNYPNVNAYPQLCVSKIEPQEDLVTLDRLIQAKAAGLIPDHPELRRQVTERLGYSLPDDAYEMPAAVPPPKANAGTPGTPPQAGADGGGATSTANDSEDPSNDAVAAAAGRRLSMRLTMRDLITYPALSGDKMQARAAGYGRTPTEFESTCLVLGQIVTAFSVSEAGLLAALKSAWRAMLDDLVARGRAGKIDKGTLDGLRRSRPKGDSGMKARVREQFLAAAMRGQQHVTEELTRQRDLATAKRRALLELVPPGGRPPRSAIAPAASLLKQVVIDELANEALITSSIAIDDLWARMTTEAVSEYQRLVRQGVEGEQLWSQLESFLSNLSPVPIEKGARHTAAVAYNEGRDLGGKTAAIDGKATWALRSEVLDQSTCDRCASLDGTMATIGSPEYDQLMPPAQCKGLENCRGIIVVLAQEVTDTLAQEAS